MQRLIKKREKTHTVAMCLYQLQKEYKTAARIEKHNYALHKPDKEAIRKDIEDNKKHNQQMELQEN